MSKKASNAHVNTNNSVSSSNEFLPNQFVTVHIETKVDNNYFDYFTTIEYGSKIERLIKQEEKNLETALKTTFDFSKDQQKVRIVEDRISRRMRRIEFTNYRLIEKVCINIDFSKEMAPSVPPTYSAKKRSKYEEDESEDESQEEDEDM